VRQVVAVVVLVVAGWLYNVGELLVHLDLEDRE
jgi:hypothetical protein